jgi:uncharacterized protein (DUF983 family)
MKNCPCCGSGKVREYRVKGVWAIRCSSCGYDSAEHDPKLFSQKHNKDKDKERGQ